MKMGRAYSNTSFFIFNKFILITLLSVSVVTSTFGMQLKMKYDIVGKALDAEGIAEVENIIGYRFKNKNLLVQALTTKAKNPDKNYERHELLGDRILDTIIVELLLKKYKDINEGIVTGAKAELVKQEPMAALCLRLGLHEYIQHSTNANIPISSLCDIIESIIGVIYEDGGMEKVQNFVLKFFIPMIEDKACPILSSKIVQQASKELHQNVVYIWRDNRETCFVIGVSTDGVILPVNTNSIKGNINTKKDPNRLTKYLAENSYKKNFQPNINNC